MQPSKILFAVILLLFAAYLFVQGMATLPLYQDEAWSITASQQPSLRAILDFSERDNHPPLHTFVLHYWGKIAGEQPFALRVIGFWSSLLCVAITFRMALDMFDLRAAVVAAIVVASSDIVLTYTPAARQYNFYLMLATLSTWLYWRYFAAFSGQRSAVSQKVSGFRYQVSGESDQQLSSANKFTDYELKSRLKPTQAKLVSQSTSVDFPSHSAGIHSGATQHFFNFYILHSTFYILSALALLYTLYWGAFILLAHGIHTLIFAPRRLQWMILPALVISLCYLPWLPKIQNSLSGAGYSMESGSPEAALAVDKKGLEIVLFQLFGIPEALFGGLAVAGIVGAYQTKKWRDYLPSSATTLAGLWLFLPVILPILITLGGYEILVHRPLVGLVPGMALLIGHLFRQIKQWQYNLLLGILLVNNLFSGEHTVPRGLWFEVADLLNQYASPADILLAESDFHAYAIEQHVQLADVPLDRVLRTNQIRNGWSGETETDIFSIVEQYDSAWLVMFAPDADISFDLILRGFVATTPQFDLGDFLNFPTTIQRFARPPQTDPIATFGENVTLTVGSHFQHHDQLHVDLTWQPQTLLDVDYSVSAFLLAPDGSLAGQHDSYPLYGESPTLSWQPGNFYFDRHNLDISTLTPGIYQLGIRVYTWQDGVSLPITPCQGEDCSYLILAEVTIE